MVARGDRPGYRIVAAQDGSWAVDALPWVTVAATGRPDALDAARAASRGNGSRSRPTHSTWRRSASARASAVKNGASAREPLETLAALCYIRRYHARGACRSPAG